MFVTLEDETGITNVVLWNQIILKHRREALKSKLLTVYGVGNPKPASNTLSPNGWLSIAICWVIS